MGCKITVFFLLAVASTAINAIPRINIDKSCTDGLSDYRFYPYDCRKYLGCVNGESKIYSCSTGFYWNEKIKACDVEEKTDCSHIIPYPEPDCSNATERYYSYPYNCAKFWECYENKPYLLTCPAKSLWNDKIKKCDEHINNVDCSGIIPIPTPKPSPTTPKPTTTSPTTPRPTTTSPTTPKPTTTSPTTPKPTTPRPTTPKPTTPRPTTTSPTTPKPTTTSPTTPKPTTPRPTTPKPTTPRPTTTSSTTPTPTTTSPTTPKPTTPRPTTTSSTTPTPTTTSPTTPKPTTPRPITTSSTHLPYTTPKIKCTTKKEYYPYPYDCHKYYECSNGEPILMECSKGMDWSQKKQTCDYPQYVDCSHIIH